MIQASIQAWTWLGAQHTSLKGHHISQQTYLRVIPLFLEMISVLLPITSANYQTANNFDVPLRTTTYFSEKKQH